MREEVSLAAAEAAARAFAGAAPVGPLETLGAGLIHQTFAAPLGTAPAHEIVVQRINTDVFSNPTALMRNLERITEHLRASHRAEGTDDVSRRVLEVLRTAEGRTKFEDSAGGVWRAFPRISRGVGLGRSRDPVRLASAARAFGDYARRLATLPAPPLHETLAEFHDFPCRREAFDAAVAADSCSRRDDAGELLDAMRVACERLEARLPDSAVKALPVRVAHHDCKIDNLLFDADSGSALCVLDLDTSMPGRLLSDFGELVRSSVADWSGVASTAAVSLDLEAFDALARGYIGELADTLTHEERDTLPLAGAQLALMNALRFATDHLAGDVYFRIAAPAENLGRARAQLALAEALLTAEGELAARVARASTQL